MSGDDLQKRVDNNSEVSDEESDERLEEQAAEDDEFAPIPAENDERSRTQYFIYKPDPRQTFYPSSWSGPKESPKEITGVYGLIICIREQVFYILSPFAVHTYRPKYPPSKKDLVGCWVLLKLDSNFDLIATPEYRKDPLHTRVFYVDEETPQYLLIYDYVKVIDESTVESRFLGQIENDIDLSCNGEMWEECNVEYVIRCGFKGKRFKHSCEVVKFHGSIGLHLGLPRILSYNSNHDDRATALYDRFLSTLYNPEEIEKNRREKIEQDRQRLLEIKQRNLPYLRKDPQENNKTEAVDDHVENKENETKSDVELPTNPIPATKQPQPTPMQQPTPSIPVIRSRPVPNLQPSSSIKNRSSQPPAQNGNEPRKTVVITYASTGYPFHLARYYLDNGHNVLLHMVDPVNKQKIVDLKIGRADRFLIYQGQLSDENVKELVENVLRKFGTIDVVFHFAATICKIGRDHGSYEQMHYLFEENVKPFVYLSKRLVGNNQIASDNLKFIVVAPIYNPKAIKPKLLPNIECFVSYLRLTINEIGLHNGVTTRVIEPREFANEINPVQQGNTEEVCRSMYEIEKSMDIEY